MAVNIYFTGDRVVRGSDESNIVEVEFDNIRHADAARPALSERFGNLLETATRNPVETA